MEYLGADFIIFFINVIGLFLVAGVLSLITISTDLIIRDVTFEQWRVNPILGEGRMIIYKKFDKTYLKVGI